MRFSECTVIGWTVIVTTIGLVQGSSTTTTTTTSAAFVSPLEWRATTPTVGAAVAVNHNNHGIIRYINNNNNNHDNKKAILFSTALTSLTSDEATVEMPILSAAELKLKKRKEMIRQEGGPFSFDTKFGALNPFAIYYGLTSILLGLPWYSALTVYQLFQFLTRGRFDKLRRVPIFLNQCWGEALMFLTRCYPVMENQDILKKFYKEGRPAMFVANHNSWMDIPFLGAAIGWRNYKLISKAELGKVPILGKAIKVGGHIMVSRDDPRSQIKTLKNGIQYLKDGVHLCTYPEGTRTRTGRLTQFKNGAFKMAHKAGVPVIPVSIVGAEHVMPVHWMFPYRPAQATHGDVVKVVMHEPVESTGKTEEELAEQVRKAMISGLPPNQRPEGEE